MTEPDSLPPEATDLESFRARVVRGVQLKALQAVKRHDPQAIAAPIADEIMTAVATLVGARAFRCIVPMP